MPIIDNFNFVYSPANRQIKVNFDKLDILLPNILFIFFMAFARGKLSRKTLQK